MNNNLKNSSFYLSNILCLVVLMLLSLTYYSFADKKEKGISVLNTPYSEDKPLINGDGTIMFFNSSKPINKNQKYYIYDVYEQTLRYDYNIYYSLKKEDGWGQPILLSEEINSKNDDAIIALSYDFKKLYFCSFGPNWEIEGGPFYEAEFIDGRIKNIKSMGGGIAKFLSKKIKVDYMDEFHEESYYDYLCIYGGSISPDGNRFYFATNIDAKYGVIDIWVSEKKDGKWQYPINLGPQINKFGAINCEPNIAPDGKTLFYSTNYESCYGDMDIYYSNYDQKNFSKPKRLGNEINTEYNELQVYYPIFGDKFYIVRNIIIDGCGNKDMREYSLVEKAKALPNYSVLNCTVTDSESGDNLDAQITIVSVNYGLTKNYTIGGNKKTLDIPLHRNLSYEIFVQKEGYEPYKIVLNLNDDLKDKNIPLNIKLKEVNNNNESFQNTHISQKQESKQIRIYPNPAFDLLCIDFSNCDDQPTWVEILNTCGERIVRFEINDIKKGGYNIDISGISYGSYIIKIGFKNSYISYKFVKS